MIPSEKKFSVLETIDRINGYKQESKGDHCLIYINLAHFMDQGIQFII